MLTMSLEFKVTFNTKILPKRPKKKEKENLEEWKSHYTQHQYVGTADWFILY